MQRPSPPESQTGEARSPFLVKQLLKRLRQYKTLVVITFHTGRTKAMHMGQHKTWADMGIMYEGKTRLFSTPPRAQIRESSHVRTFMIRSRMGKKALCPNGLVKKSAKLSAVRTKGTTSVKSFFFLARKSETEQPADTSRHNPQRGRPPPQTQTTNRFR